MIINDNICILIGGFGILRQDRLVYRLDRSYFSAFTRNFCIAFRSSQPQKCLHFFSPQLHIFFSSGKNLILHSPRFLVSSMLFA